MPQSDPIRSTAGQAQVGDVLVAKDGTRAKVVAATDAKVCVEEPRTLRRYEPSRVWYTRSSKRLALLFQLEAQS